MARSTRLNSDHGEGLRCVLHFFFWESLRISKILT